MIRRKRAIETAKDAARLVALVGLGITAILTICAIPFGLLWLIVRIVRLAWSGT